MNKCFNTAHRTKKQGQTTLIGYYNGHDSMQSINNGHAKAVNSDIRNSSLCVHDHLPHRVAEIIPKIRCRPTFVVFGATERRSSRRLKILVLPASAPAVESVGYGVVCT